MEDEVRKMLGEMKAELDAVYKSTEKTRRYIRLTLILSIVFVVLPLIGLLFVVPKVMDVYLSGLTF